MYPHAITINEIRGHEFEESWGQCRGQCGGKKGKI